MEAAFHRQRRARLRAVPQHEPAAVAGGRRLREVRDRLVIERGGDVDLLGQTAEAGAENDAGVRRLRPRFADRGGGVFDLVVEFEHCLTYARKVNHRGHREEHEESL